MLTLKNPSPMTIIGINTWHDWGCCLIHKDKLIAISEERLTRKKHCSWYIYALEYVLSSLNLTINDVDKFVFSSYHEDIPNNYVWKLKHLNINTSKFWSIDHHLSHAYSWYYLSWFDEALIIVIDWLGNNKDTESYYIWKWNDIVKIWWNKNNRSIYRWIWRTYETFTNFIWRPTTDAWKTMWLSSYGEYHWENIKLFDIDTSFSVSARLDGKYEFAALNFLKQNNLETLFQLKWQKEKCSNVASFIQYHLEKVICELIDWLVKKTGIRKLCLVWWVALNWLVNQKLIDEWIIDEIYIPPFPCDTWQCVWNAIGWLAKEWIFIKQQLRNSYLWRKYSDEEILDIFNKKQKIFPLPYEIKKTEFSITNFDEVQFIEKVSELIAKWKIVWWFQWWSELGPRALWNRSILANPTLTWMKDYINSKVKHRESFRPFAWSLCYEDAQEYFYINKESPFMMLIYKIKDKYLDKLPWITHIDNTCRLQTVKEEDNAKYYKLLKSIKKHTWFSIILNTSFNDNNEPIVETPVEALRHLAIWNIDVLALDNYIITKSDEKN
jgi:carbamoyltransferase